MSLKGRNAVVTGWFTICFRIYFIYIWLGVNQGMRGQVVLVRTHRPE